MKNLLIILSFIAAVFSCGSPDVTPPVASGGSGGIGSTNCSSRNDCEHGYVCITGTCYADISFGGSFGTGSTNNVGGNCASINVEFEKQIPTVVLLIDRSGSMTETDFSPNRWLAVKDALLNAESGIVKQLENDVRFGLALYNSNNGFGGSGNRECPIMKTTEPALGSFSVIEAEFDEWNPHADTPTGDSIDWVTDWLADYDEPGQKVIVLATDGEPDTCEIPNPNDPIGNPAGREESRVATAAAYNAGIHTYVISVGNEVAGVHLQELANLGKGKEVDAVDAEPYYIATDSQSLVDAFDVIINGVRSCEFDLNGTIHSNAQNSGTVILNGTTLIKDDENGYTVTLPSTIELVGQACEAIKSGEQSLSISFPCGAFNPR